MPILAPPVRPPAVAGQFYPAAPAVLRKQVDSLLDAAPDAKMPGEIVALIAPHAGYPYSGSTAATAYRQVRGKHYDAVVVVAPSHRDVFEGVSIMAEGAYETPLGEMPVQTDIASRIMASDPEVHDTRLGHGSEHAVEVELPFIQRALGAVPIVPIVMLDRSWDTCRSLGDAIDHATVGMNVLVVASSDLYHGYSEQECRAVDERTLHEAESSPPETFCRDLVDDRVQACGGGPIAVAKEFARLRGATGADILAHRTSADVAGSTGGYVVGYGAVAFYRPEEIHESPPGLSAAERAEVLDLARKSIRAAVEGGVEPDAATASAALQRPAGAFVTIRRRGELRGCIGSIYATASLAETVIRMARSAALSDPRFPPMTPDELSDATFDVSVLSEMRPIKPGQVVVGKHGLLVSGRGRRGVLLPQVPTEQGWDRETYLQQVCRKAGLPPNAWRDPDVALEAFTAEVFGDDKPVGAGG